MFRNLEKSHLGLACAHRHTLCLALSLLLSHKHTCTQMCTHAHTLTASLFSSYGFNKLRWDSSGAVGLNGLALEMRGEWGVVGQGTLGCTA